jgi:RNA polymerase sigma factor (sigma-70 family)
MSPSSPLQRIPVSEALRAAEQRLHALMVASQAGDAAAYEALLRALAPHLRAFLRRRMQQWPGEVEDILQECLLALHNQRHTWDAHLPVTAWMQAIAKYKLIDWLRRHGRRDAYHVEYDDDAVMAGADGAGTQGAQEASRDLAVLLALLPQQQQAAIVHTKLDGWSVRETAQALRISEASVKTAVHRGLKALAEKLRTMT